MILFGFFAQDDSHLEGPKKRYSHDVHLENRQLAEMHEYWCRTPEPETMIDRMDSKICQLWYGNVKERNAALKAGKRVPKPAEEDMPPIEDVRARKLMNS